MINKYIAALLLLLSTSAFARTSDPCQQPNRIEYICKNMRHLRSHVMILDTQRELLQINYPLLAELAASVEQIVTKLMISRYYNEHLVGIEPVRELAKEIRKQADQKNPQALRLANELPGHCRNCHQSSEPTSGFPFEALFAESWDTITPRCNESGNLPYSCKYLNAIVKTSSFFTTAAPLDDLNFKLSELLSVDINRQASWLLPLGDNAHAGALASLNDVVSRSLEIANQARAENPTVFENSQKVLASCQTCHAAH